MPEEHIGQQLAPNWTRVSPRRRVTAWHLNAGPADLPELATAGETTVAFAVAPAARAFGPLDLTDCSVQTNCNGPFISMQTLGLGSAGESGFDFAHHVED
jgi:hypothetical protein